MRIKDNIQDIAELSNLITIQFLYEKRGIEGDFIDLWGYTENPEAEPIVLERQGVTVSAKYVPTQRQSSETLLAKKETQIAQHLFIVRYAQDYFQNRTFRIIWQNQVYDVLSTQRINRRYIRIYTELKE